MKVIDNKNLFLLEEIIKRNFSIKYKDSTLGILWSVLKPLAMMVILTIVFSTIFKGRIENYPVYLLSGRCIFFFFVDAISAAMKTLKSNKNILQKTAAPKHIFILGNIFAEFINFIISVVLLMGIMLLTHTPFNLFVMPFSIIPVIAVILMSIGLGLMLAILTVYYTDMYHLWTVITMLLMYASAIFYPMDIIPEPFHRFAVLSPLYWAIDQFRNTIYQGIIPSILYMVNLLLVSAMVFIFGIIIYKKYENKVLIKL